MCTRHRKECCGSAALWPSTRPKPIVSGETTCLLSSHVGPHRLTWTFAGVLCQGSGAKKAGATNSRAGRPVHPQEGRSAAFRRRAASTSAQTTASSSLPRPSCCTRQRNASRRSTSSNGAPQPTAQKVPTKSGGSCSSPSAKPKPTGRTSPRICSAVPRIA